ncbi:MAG: hypothetical protein VCC01_12640 [Candidatus Hydrogenedentota bacterium]
MQKIPFFNFLYGHLTGNDCEVQEATQSLREWSLDSVGYSYRNSERTDLRSESGYVPYMGGTKAVSERNLVSSWGARTKLQYDGGRGGRAVTPPVGWLEDYWMGRYFGMIEAPGTTDPALLGIEGDSNQPPKAATYDGPPRPDVSFR